MKSAARPEEHNDVVVAQIVAPWLERCRFPEVAVAECAFSGGPDSTALIVLATAAGLRVRAHHVDHGHRPGTADDARRAAAIADIVGAEFVLHRARLKPTPNFEAAARHARRRLIGAAAMTGHTADDLAETVLFRLLRGSGVDGLAAMRPDDRHPILALRRADTAAVCAAVGVQPIHDPTNDRADHVRNRIRNELLPLAADIMDRDCVPLIARAAGHAGEQRDLIDQWCEAVDPTDVTQLRSLHPALARHVLRRFVQQAHPQRYPPDARAIDRLLKVVHGDSVACELPGGLRVERSRRRLRIVGEQR